jgi:hypothetical protein
VAREPLPRQLDHLVERARLREQVAGTGDDLQASRAAEPLEGLPVQLEHAAVASAHDQQRRRPRRGDQRRRSAGAGAEAADRQAREVVLLGSGTLMGSILLRLWRRPARLCCAQPLTTMLTEVNDGPYRIGSTPRRCRSCAWARLVDEGVSTA